MRSYTAAAVLFFAGVAGSAWSQPGQQPKYLEIEGTITDAAGEPIKSGEVHFTPSRGSLGDSKTSIRNGEYRMKVPMPPNKTAPIKFRLTYFADEQYKLPPHWVEQLSPRLPVGDKQRIHVVLYTNDQLGKADVTTLLSEGQQLEKSLIGWMQAKEEFKVEYHRFFSLPALQQRRNVIYTAWEGAAAQAEGISPAYSNELRNRYSDKSPLAIEMSKALPSK